MAHVKRGFAGLAAVVVALLLLPGRADAASIQPGDEMISGDVQCTLGFVVTSPTDTYFLTAAHCVKVPAEVKLADGTVFGDAVAEGNSLDVPPTLDDWALISVRPHMVSSVSPAVRGGGVPSGVVMAGETGGGDLIKHSGYGVPWWVTPTTREQRYGVLVSQTQETWASIGPDTFGDSGGPVVHVASGKALGLVSRGCIGVCTSLGPTIEDILIETAAVGYPVTLRTS
jgi:hypothetical protein